MSEPAVRAALEEIGSRADCTVLPSRGQPAPPDGLALPGDLAVFYDLCGGATLFEHDLGWRVSGPDELVPAAPRLMTQEIAEELRREQPDHLGNTCFVFADNGGGLATEEHVVVDLHPDRAGRFYDTFWDRYPWPGDMPIIALSVADALRWLLDTEGGGPEVALAKRAVLGDAFD